MQLESDTDLLQFLVMDGGHLSSNCGLGYIYWYGTKTAHTEIVEGRTFRQALNQAYHGEVAK